MIPVVRRHNQHLTGFRTTVAEVGVLAQNLLDNLHYRFKDVERATPLLMGNFLDPRYESQL